MRKTCSEEGCDAPKSLCKQSLSADYQDCPHWTNTSVDAIGVGKKDSSSNTAIPWSGMELTPDKIDILSHRSTPLIIGIIGAANAGKTSYLGMLYTLLFNGRKFAKWNFAGSYTLVAWEAQAKGLKIGSNGKVPFPKSTPSTPDYYSLYHFALKNDNRLYDVLFADSSGEVFTKWAANTDDPEAENAKWIYHNSDAFIFFVDCEALITGRGRARMAVSQLAGQVAAGLKNKPVILVWSKADKIDDIPTTIREAVEQTLKDSFPGSLSFLISNFSKVADDKLCHVNNLAATESTLDLLIEPKSLNLIPGVPLSNDFFINYHGSDEFK